MIDLKKLLIKILTSFVPTSRTVNNKPLSSDISLTASDVNAVAKSGDTMTNNLTVSSSEATERYVKAENSTGAVYLDINGSGTHGVWSRALSKWLIRGETAGTVFINNIDTANLVRKDTANTISGGSLNVSASDTTERFVRVYNSAGSVFLDVTEARHGIWSGTHSRWLIRAETNTGTTNGTVYVNDTIIPKSSTLVQKATANGTSLTVTATAVQSMVMFNAVPVFVYCTGTSNIQVVSPYAQQAYASSNGTLTFNATGIGFDVTIKRLSTNYQYSITTATSCYITSFYA